MKRAETIDPHQMFVDGVPVRKDPVRKHLNIVILGLSITSSWGNGHATTYRGLAQQLQKRGHRVTFLERDLEWYAANRDLPEPPYCETHLYNNLHELQGRFASTIREADV